MGGEQETAAKDGGAEYVPVVSTGTAANNTGYNNDDDDNCILWTSVSPLDSLPHPDENLGPFDCLCGDMVLTEEQRQAKQVAIDRGEWPPPRNTRTQQQQPLELEVTTRRTATLQEEALEKARQAAHYHLRKLIQEEHASRNLARQAAQDQFKRLIRQEIQERSHRGHIITRSVAAEFEQPQPSPPQKLQEQQQVNGNNNGNRNGDGGGRRRKKRHRLLPRICASLRRRKSEGGNGGSGLLLLCKRYSVTNKNSLSIKISLDNKEIEVETGNQDYDDDCKDHARDEPNKAEF